MLVVCWFSRNSHRVAGIYPLLTVCKALQDKFHMLFPLSLLPGPKLVYHHSTQDIMEKYIPCLFAKEFHVDN